MVSAPLVAGAKGAADYVTETFGVPVAPRSIYHLVEIERLQPIRPSGNPKGKAYFQKADLDRLFSRQPADA